MNLKKSYQKRLILRDTNGKGFDVSRFTFSLRQSDTTVTSTEYRKRKIIKATVVQKDKVLDCLDVPETSFVYQMNNACCKSYTLESV